MRRGGRGGCATHLGIFSALVRKQSDSIRILAVAHRLHIRRGSPLCVRTDLDPEGQFVRRTALHMMRAPPRCATSRRGRPSVVPTSASHLVELPHTPARHTLFPLCSSCRRMPRAYSADTFCSSKPCWIALDASSVGRPSTARCSTPSPHWAPCLSGAGL